MIMTFEVVQVSKGWLNLDAVENALDKSTTFEVSQVPTGPLKLTALLNKSACV